MNADYQNLRAQADKLFHHFNDMVDDKNAGAAIAQEIRTIVEECEMAKNPHSIEDRIKHVTEELKQLRRDGSGVMNFRHLDELCEGFEELRREVRGFSNY